MFLRDEVKQLSEDLQKSGSPILVEGGQRIQALLDSGVPLLKGVESVAPKNPTSKGNKQK